MILNAEQSRGLKRAQRAGTYFDDNTEIYNQLKPFAHEVALIGTNKKAIEDLMPQKEIVGKSITKEKKRLKKSIALQVNNICTRTVAYARVIGDETLEASVAFTTSKIMRLKETEVLGTANIIVDAITPLLSKAAYQEYNVTEEMLAAMVADAILFTGYIGKANIIDSNSSVINKSINSYLKAIEGNIQQCNLLISFFIEKYPDFVAGYYLNSVIDETGIHHTGIEGVLLTDSSGEPIEGGTITDVKSRKKVESDLKGNYRFIKLQAGERKLLISAPGALPKTMIVKMVRGKILPLNIAI